MTEFVDGDTAATILKDVLWDIPEDESEVDYSMENNAAFRAGLVKNIKAMPSGGVVGITNDGWGPTQEMVDAAAFISDEHEAAYKSLERRG